ncbi:thermonuclease family protein [Bradyrhizobium sp. ISRA463]|uniref:thermonuclease family protein n=1 Tax=Bradyrhizobium sp. ISRA463 TaxID=2866199 RepID=UPI002478C5C1|nr:thermonuclease family protein [Bradyrhizobium sp. ISRA463]WGS19273.1 thermonuclease family protein [Bradyrhizobium sp. ISRA463]
MSLLVIVASAAAQDVTGKASVIDGDTIEIHGSRIRIWGIDAPESSQLCRNQEGEQYRCGARAANALDAFIASRSLSCIEVGRDRYGRSVATCSVGKDDLGEWLVRNGHALDWARYSGGAYALAQRQAKQAEQGMWEGSYVEPWRYRACMRKDGSLITCSDEGVAE